jgi:hypothetical protein
MWMRLPIGRPKHHISRVWSQTKEEDQCPTTAYLWDWVALAYATQAHAYIEYSNKLATLVPSSISTCSSFLIFVTL